MSTLSLRLPESLHERARQLAEREGTSINQLLATALAEKISALDTVGYLEERGARGSLEAFRSVLDQVPDVPPVPGDEVPDGRKVCCQDESVGSGDLPVRHYALPVTPHP